MGYPAVPDEKWEELLDLIAEGRKPMSGICDDLGMSRKNVYQRIERDPDFAERLRVRKAIGVRNIVDDCLTIADESATTEMDVKNKRIRIDTRLRLAGKWSPKEFGDKVQLTGGDGGPIEYRNLSDEEVDARIAEIVGAGVADKATD